MKHENISGLPRRFAHYFCHSERSVGIYFRIKIKKSIKKANPSKISLFQQIYIFINLLFSFENPLSLKESGQRNFKPTSHPPS